MDDTNKIEHAKKRAFLAAIAVSGTILSASKAADVSRTTHYEWMKHDPEYAAACALAKEEFADSLENEVTRRAREGVEEPVFYQGRIVGHVKRYSDNLAMFMLKGERPEKFQERFKGELAGPDGAPLQVVFNIPRPGGTPDGGTSEAD